MYTIKSLSVEQNIERKWDIGAGTPYISQILKYLKWQNVVYQLTENFMLISKMYNFMGLSCIFLDLWSFESWKRPVFPKIQISGLFQPSNGHKSRYMQNKPIKLYIFEISVKFCVEWYTPFCHLRYFKIWLIQGVPAPISHLRSMLCSTESDLMVYTRYLMMSDNFWTGTGSCARNSFNI